MFVNILFFAFLSAFIAIVALGHAMLLAAIWPNLFASRNDRARDVEFDSEQPSASAGR